jgi:hypothetical protein
LNKALNIVDRTPIKAATVFKSDGREPELCLAFAFLDVNVRWLVAVSRVEIETVRLDTQGGRHE